MTLPLKVGKKRLKRIELQIIDGQINRERLLQPIK